MTYIENIPASIQPAQVRDVAIPPASRAAVRALSQDRPVSRSLPDPAAFSGSLAGQVSALATIQNASDLDQIVDRLHEFSTAHSSNNDAVVLGISTAFAKISDTKLFALCRQWEEKYPADRGAILTSLNGVWRSGTPEGFGPVRGLATAYEVISGSMGSATMLAGINPHGLMPDIVGLYNVSSLRDILNVYFDSSGRTINGYHGNQEGFVTQFLISVPPDDRGRKNGERNLMTTMSGQGYYTDADKSEKPDPDAFDKEAIRSKLEYLGVPWESVYSGLEQKPPAEYPGGGLKKSAKKIIPPGSYAEMVGDIVGSLAGQGPMPGSEGMPFDGTQPKN